jgi:hypothetical protein
MSERTRMCMVCSQLIDAERAAHMPNTNLCAEHGAEIERRFGGEFKIVGVQESLQKENSMKKNYGAIATRMELNKDALQELRDEYRSRQTR